MARYIDADKLAKMIEARAEQLIEGKGALLYVAKWLNLLPTADVVPKSEVEKQVAKQKAMLFDVIDTFRNLLCIDSYLEYEDTRKHYAVSIDDVNRIHDELLKKYTGDKV